MSDDVTGWTEVGVVEDGDLDDYEEAEHLAHELDGNHRVATIKSSDKHVVEVEIQSYERWVRVSTLTGPEPYEDAENLADSLSNCDEYRVVDVKGEGFAVEKCVRDDS